MLHAMSSIDRRITPQMLDVPPNSLQATSSSEFFTAYFQALEAAHVPYVVLHGYEQYPKHIGSDVDYAVRNGDLPKAAWILRATCKAHDWAIAQILQHTVFGYYFVAYNRRSIGETIKLDVCSHYGRSFALLLKDVDLLEGRRVQSGFYVPAPHVEFKYVLAKAFAKGKPLAAVAPRLLELADLDSRGCAAAFTRLTGLHAEKLTAVCGGTLHAERWRQMRSRVLLQHSSNPLFAAKEFYRRARRFLRPTGLVVGILGVDGSGKSTLLENLLRLLAPFFRQYQTLHFQPGLFRRRQVGPVEHPHAMPPRSRPVSWLKMFYYYADWLVGYFCDLRCRIVRSTLVVSDRTLHDVVIDPARYRLQGSSFLANALRRALPAPELVLILTGPAETIHARKPELPVAEIERQQDMLRRLPAADQGMRIIDAGQTPDLVANDSAKAVLQFMTERCAQQRIF
jgi:thymidylate kinase